MIFSLHLKGNLATFSLEHTAHTPVFPQLKNEFPGMNSEISRNLSKFPGTEEGHIQCLLDAPKSSQFAQHNLHKCPFLK